MDALRVTAARAAGEAQPSSANRSQTDELLKYGAAAAGGFILGDLLDIFD